MKRDFLIDLENENIEYKLRTNFELELKEKLDDLRRRLKIEHEEEKNRLKRQFDEDFEEQTRTFDQSKNLYEKRIDDLRKENLRLRGAGKKHFILTFSKKIEIVS